MNLIPVAITWYPRGRGEETFWVKMTHVPPIGASISGLQKEMPTLTVRHVAWVPEDWPDKDKGAAIPEHWTLWHVEIGLSY